jgi:hypothetical protein
MSLVTSDNGATSGSVNSGASILKASEGQEGGNSQNNTSNDTEEDTGCKGRLVSTIDSTSRNSSITRTRDSSSIREKSVNTNDQQPQGPANSFSNYRAREEGRKIRTIQH